jgi:TP901 family phage tail tape measure protein
MAGVAKGIIDIQINTGAAAAQLKTLLGQINSFNSALAKGNVAQGKMFSEYTKDLSKAINSSGVFTSEFVKINSAASNLDNTLKRGRGTLGQFFSSAFNKNSANFAATMDLAARRASTLQTQFINTGASAKGMGEALAIRPLDAYSSKAAIAAERQALLNTMFRQGTTHMINFGKNVQWAGRQLMVGFTVPLTVLGTVAGKTFMDIEKELVNLKKVYGDAFTTPEEVNQNIAQVRQLAEEYTKYGIAVKDTIGMAANAAASGARNADLIDATRQATRLATLGQMEQQEALKTTIALQSAFRLSGEDLADTINFLNMVENQTVVSLQDLSAAIPRVAPVIKGLGGDVRDMSVFLAAMQEGGVSAEQGANALKSGLASLINPTKAATETLSGFGINLDKIISTNRGDLMGTVFAFGEALKGLDDFSKQQALEKVFGKYQYARLGALFENIVRDGSQASQVLQLMEYDVAALRTTAEKELGAVENALGTQLIGAVERLKLSLEPIGELFVRLAIPFVNFLTTIVEKFNGLSDGQKKFAAIAAVIVGVVVPAGTMFLGLLINLLGTLGKITHGFGIFGKALIKGGPVAAVKALTQSTKYLSIEELEAAGAAKQLAASSQIANDAMLKQATATGIAEKAVAGLVSEYLALITVQKRAAATVPGLSVAGAAGAAAAAGGKGNKAPKTAKRNKGGEIFMSGQTTVPGMGNTDTVPAMLTPGEFVVNKEATAKNYALLDAINSGNNFNNGGMIPGMQYFAGPRPNRVVKKRNNNSFRREDVAFGEVGKGVNTANAKKQQYLEDRVDQARNQENAGMPPRANNVEGQIEKQPYSKNNYVYALEPSDNQALRSQGISSKGFIERMLSSESMISFEASAKAAGSKFDKVAYRQAVETRHQEILKTYPGKEIYYVDRLSNSGTIEAIGKNPNIQYVPLSSLHSKEVLDTLSPEHRDFLRRSSKNLTDYPFRKPSDYKKHSFIKEHFKDEESFPKPGEITRFSSDPYSLYDIKTRSPIASYVSQKPNSGGRQDTRAIGPGDRLVDSTSGGIFEFDGKSWKKIGQAKRKARDQKAEYSRTIKKYFPEVDLSKRQLSHVVDVEGLNKGGIAGGMQYFGARMPNRVVAKNQFERFTGTKIEDSTGHSSRFRDIAGVYDVNGRKMFVKPFQTLEEAQAELIGNAARRRIAGTATPGSRIVRMNGPDGEIFATTAPMIPGMKAGTTLSTKELLKQIPASSMLGDMDATAGNILSTGGGRLATIDPGAAGVKLIRNSKGVFRRATGSEISFGDEATNTGAYTAKAITQVIEKTGASKDFVKMLGDSIAREGLTKAQFAKMYDDVVEASIARVPSFKLPSRIGDRSKLDDAAKSAGYKNADEAYSAIMLRDLTSIRGLGGDIYSSASRFQGILKANNGTLVPGVGNTDTVPAMLTPGEFVVNKDATGKNLPLLQAINSGNMQGFNSGGKIPGMQYFAKENRQRMVLPTLPGMPSRRASIMMGMSDPYQMQSRSNTGQGVFKDTSVTLSSTAKRMIETFKTISAKNMVYASAGEKYFQAREAIEKKVQSQQNIHKDRMIGLNRQLSNVGTAMTAAKDIVSKSSKDMGRSILNAGTMVSDRVKNIPGDMSYKRSQDKIRKNTPEGKAAALAKKEARSQRIQRASGGMAMAGMLPMMASGFVDDPKQQQGLMIAGGAMTLIPMLMQLGKTAGTAAAGVALLAGGFVMMRKHVDGLAKSSAVAGSNLGGAANRMEGISSATGYSFASVRSAAEDYRFTEKQAEGVSEVMPFFDTDEGKKMVEELKKASSEDRYTKVASMLEMAIADGMDPKKAESFGSAIAFALDDSLLKSKVIGLVRSGTLKSGSQAMISSIEKRQAALNQELPEVKSNRFTANQSFVGGALAGGAAGAVAGGIATSWTGPFAAFGIALGAVVGAVGGAAAAFFANKKAVEKNVAAVGKTFGSSIQTLKELNNAEALLNEERKNGSINTQEFEAREKKIQELRSISYDNIENAVMNTTDSGATQQTIADQLFLSGFDSDSAAVVARATDRDKVSAEVFGEADFSKLDTAQQEIVSSIIASTLDGLTPENYGTKIGDIEGVWALYKEKLLKASEDGSTPTPQEMKAIMESAQLEKFVASTIASSPTKDYDPQAVATKMQTAIADSGTTLSFTQIESALTELGDPDLAIKIGTTTEGIKDLESVLNAMPDGFDLSMYTSYLNGDTEFTDPEAYTKSMQDTIDKIAKIAPEGFEPIELFKLFEGTGKDPVKEIEKAVKDSQDLMNQIGGDDAKVKDVVFESTGYEMTQKEVDEFNALPDSQQKSYLASFMIATAIIGDAPNKADYAKYGLAAGEAYRAAMADWGKEAKEKTDFIQSLGIGGNTQSVNNGGGGSAPSKKKQAKNFLKDTKANNKELKEYTNLMKGSAKANNIEALSMIPQDVYLNTAKKKRGELIEAIQKQIKLQNRLNAVMVLAQSKKATEDLAEYSKALGSLGTGITSDIEGMIDQKAFLAMTSEERKEYIAELNKQSVAQARLAATLALADAEKQTQDISNYSKALSGLGVSVSSDIEGMIDQKAFLAMNTAERKAYIAELNKQSDAQKKLNAVTELTDIKKNTQNLQNHLDLTKTLVSQGISGEIAGLIDIELYQNLNTAAKKEYIATLTEQMNVQKALEFYTKSSQERQLEALELQNQALDLSTKASEEKMSLLQRESEMLQRDVADRNRALELLSREEERVNKVYDQRIKALDSVSKANDRLASKQQNQISLASALASGDIAGAASSVSQMTAESAQNQIEDTRAALENQREADLKALKISVNGVMMTREEIEASILSISDSIYLKEQQIIGIQDTLYQKSLDQQKLDKERLRLETEITLQKTKQAIEAIRATNPTGQALKDFEKLVAGYNALETAAVANATAEGTTIKTPGQTNATVAGEAPTGSGSGSGSGSSSGSSSGSGSGSSSDSGSSSTNTLPSGHIAGDKLFNKMIDLYKKLSDSDKKDFKSIAEKSPGTGYATWIARRKSKHISNGNLDNVIAVMKDGKITKDEVKKYDGKLTFNTGGLVPGVGSMDNVSAKLTPGEFIIKKAMVGKYGTPLLEAINMGSFNLPDMQEPKFSIGGIGGINPGINGAKNSETMYNNTYNVNVNVAGTDTSADEIARVVIDKISQAGRGNLRSSNY